MAEQAFDFDSGALCLDFANTVDWHASEQPQDRLQDYSDLLAWGMTAGIIDRNRSSMMRVIADAYPSGAATAFERGVNLREAIYRIFVKQAAEQAVDADDVAILNQALHNTRAHLQVVTGKDGFATTWQVEDNDLEQVLWAVARSAADLLTSDKLDRVRQCADDRGCGYLFFDTSRNRSRRWCSMETCGNRAKARRHYRRQTEEVEG